MQNFLKVDLSSDTLSDKLAFLEANPSANIKRTLDGEELTATETAIFESQNHNQIIKDREEYFLDSFSKFIKLAIAPYNIIKSKDWD
ncbi:hypothetical protein RhiirA4_473785 [Rhizophagus irregularis]|uniref:Uncharacterized protein n=1 Tax=Rhizophagus irregularis TaxID=588596 RepID=A0A2I1H7C9_9GLOM|nr:hypothetical protein RhiirA4_473785 [Rhizophagus irregularis]